MDEIILNKNMLKFKKSESARYLDETFIGNLQFDVDFKSLQCIDFKSGLSDLLANDSCANEMQSTYIDFLGDGLFFTAYQCKDHSLKFATFNEGKSVMESFVHETGLKSFNHFMTCQSRNLVIVDYGFGGLFRVFDKKLCIAKEACFNDMDLKGKLIFTCMK